MMVCNISRKINKVLLKIKCINSTQINNNCTEVWVFNNKKKSNLVMKKKKKNQYKSLNNNNYNRKNNSRSSKYKT